MRLSPEDKTSKLEKLRAYNSMCDKWNMLMSPEPVDNIWGIERIVATQIKTLPEQPKSIFFKARYHDGDQSWLPLDVLRLEDPYLLINHVYSKNLDTMEEFSWIRDYFATDTEMEVISRLYKTKAVQTSGKVYKFGIEVPRSPKHALEIDKLEGVTEWAKSIKLELDQILCYDTFIIIPEGDPLPPGYKRIPYHIIHDVKFDGRKKSRLVAGGHMSPDVPKEEAYSGVVSMEAVRLGFMLAKLNGLQVCAGDVLYK